MVIHLVASTSEDLSRNLVVVLAATLIQVFAPIDINSALEVLLDLADHILSQKALLANDFESYIAHLSSALFSLCITHNVSEPVLSLFANLLLILSEGLSVAPSLDIRLRRRPHTVIAACSEMIQLFRNVLNGHPQLTVSVLRRFIPSESLDIPYFGILQFYRIHSLFPVLMSLSVINPRK
jgi:hypothetical protein